MVTITEAVATATFALKVAKDLREIDRSVSDAEFKLKIADLSTTLADVKLAMVDLGDDLRAKDAKISDLEAAVRKRAQLIESHGYQYEAVGGRPVGKAFCNVCLDEGRFIRIETRIGATCSCPRCNAQYGRVTAYPYPADEPT